MEESFLYINENLLISTDTAFISQHSVHNRVMAAWSMVVLLKEVREYKEQKAELGSRFTVLGEKDLLR